MDNFAKFKTNCVGVDVWTCIYCNMENYCKSYRYKDFGCPDSLCPCGARRCLYCSSTARPGNFTFCPNCGVCRKNFSFLRKNWLSIFLWVIGILVFLTILITALNNGFTLAQKIHEEHIKNTEN